VKKNQLPDSFAQECHGLLHRAELDKQIRMRQIRCSLLYVLADLNFHLSLFGNNFVTEKQRNERRIARITQIQSAQSEKSVAVPGCGLFVLECNPRQDVFLPKG
jgi:hypothetical protein